MTNQVTYSVQANFCLCFASLVYCYFQEKIDTIHEQVIRGDIRHVRNLLDKKGWANARDHYGHSPLHKSIMANQEEIMRFILGTYPDHVEDRDNVIGFLFLRNLLSNTSDSSTNSATTKFVDS